MAYSLRKRKLNNMKKNFPYYKQPFIVPSLLSADFSNLEMEIRRVEKFSGWIQLDIMDGHFVKNLSFGPHIAKCVSKITKLPLDIHLMVEYPFDFIEIFAASQADIITVHYESFSFIKAIKEIKKRNLKAGIAIKPETEFEAVIPYLDMVDLLLIMTVEPGFGGQKFIVDMLDKIKKARDFFDKKHMKKYIQIDGGVNEKNIIDALNSGANSFVCGTSVFDKNKPGNIKKMYNLIYGDKKRKG